MNVWFDFLELLQPDGDRAGLQDSRGREERDH
jgi:hypothetical protein